MLIDIDKITVKDRIRKDYGNLEELAEDIKKNGLINPPAISRTYQLIAGERRLKACRDILGWKQIEVHQMDVDDAEKQLYMEISENESRKEFTMMERLDYARQIARVESEKAQGRMLSGKKDPTQNSAEGGETRDKVASAVDMSHDTLRKAQFIADHKDDIPADDFADWDEGRLSTNKVFQNLKNQLADEKERTQTLAGIRDRLVLEKADLKKKLSETDTERTDELEAQIRDLKQQLEDAKNDSAEWETSYNAVVGEMKRMDENPKIVTKEVLPRDYQETRSALAETQIKLRSIQKTKEIQDKKMYEQGNEIRQLKSQLDALSHAADNESEDMSAAVRSLTWEMQKLRNTMTAKIGQHHGFVEQFKQLPTEERNALIAQIDLLTNRLCKWRDMLYDGDAGDGPAEPDDEQLTEETD